jgi:quinol monooxygenase YgiN
VSADPAHRALSPDMVVHTARLTVETAHADAFRERITRHAQQSRAEPGCVAFEVYEESGAVGSFLLFEAYRNVFSLDSHRASPHFRAFRADVDSWVLRREWSNWSVVSLG